MFRIEINDGIVKSMCSTSRVRLIDMVREHYEEAEIECDDTDEGELVSFKGGPGIGYIKNVK